MALQTCALLIRSVALRNVLAAAASVLGVDVPQEPAAEEGVPRRNRNGMRNLGFYLFHRRSRKPNSRAPAEHTFDLPAYAEEKNTTLDPRTISQAKSLCDQTSPGTFRTTLYFAAVDIWRAIGRAVTGSCSRWPRTLLFTFTATTPLKGGRSPQLNDPMGYISG